MPQSAVIARNFLYILLVLNMAVIAQHCVVHCKERLHAQIHLPDVIGDPVFPYLNTTASLRCYLYVATAVMRSEYFP